MGIYIALLIFVSALALLLSHLYDKNTKKDKFFLAVAFGAILLIYSLRASTVGRDLPGYERVYLISGNYDWFDTSYVYFESGYVFLMKLCSTLKLSFQGFLLVVNLLILVPIFCIIRKYSHNYYLSVMVYICYMYFEFNMTALRQAIASSIILIGIMLLIGSSKWGIIKYTAMVLLATLFHSGAFVALLYIPFHYIRTTRMYVAGIAFLGGTSLLFRNRIYAFIRVFLGESDSYQMSGLYIGLNLMFLLGLAVLFALYANNLKYRTPDELISVSGEDHRETVRTASAFYKFFLVGIVSALFFGMDVAARSHMILCQTIFILLPNCVDIVFPRRSVGLVRVLVAGFLVLFFVANTLVSNSFDIIPYTFYWQ